MTFLSWHLLWFAIACFFVPWPVCANQPVQLQDPYAWLSRIHRAAEKNSYQGTFVVSGRGSVSSMRITHYAVGNQQYEHIESLDGPARQVFRHNDVVRTVWPQSHVVQLERRLVRDSFPGLLKGSHERLTDFYLVKHLQDDRVAGFDAHVLLLEPRDALRFGFMIWTEKQTGLLLRSDVLSQGGEVLETSAFSELKLGLRPRPAKIIQAINHLSTYQVSHSTMYPTELAREGWLLRSMVPGFYAVSCIKRSLSRPSNPQAIQSVFSDGLGYVSLFIEPYRSAHHSNVAPTLKGATHTVAKRHADAWLTAVGDVPVATLRAFLDRLEPVKP